MTFENFIVEFETKVNSLLEEGMSLRRINMTKNNDTCLYGLTIHSEDDVIEPTIYLNHYYEQFLAGIEIDELANFFFVDYESHKIDCDIDFSFFENYESVKDNILFKVVNTKMNENRLSNMPHIDFLDLSIIFFYRLDQNIVPGGNCVISITDEHCESWNVTANDLYEVARKNTPSVLSASVRNLYDVLTEMIGEQEIDGLPADEMFSPKIYLLTNSEKTNGASAILYEDVLRSFADYVEKDLYIIPSSVHEVLIIPVDDDTREMKEYIKSTIPCVNENEVDDMDILSDNLYFYSRSEDRLDIA